mgnify:CR=1 FL=1
MENVPITIGRVLSQEELRAFIKCSQFFYYGGLVQETSVQAVVRKTTEYMLAYSLKEDLTNPALGFATALRRIFVGENLEARFSDTECNEILRACTKALHGVWRELDPEVYFPVAPALDYRFKVSCTPIDIHLSGLLRRKQNKELVIPLFTPYASNHSAENDPILHMQLNLVKQFGTKHWQRPTVTAKTMYISDSGDLQVCNIGDTSYNGDEFRMIEQVVKCLESGYHFPIVPCTGRCPFKLNCFPGRKDEFVRN